MDASSPNESLLARLEADRDWLRVVSTAELAGPAAELLEVEDLLSQVVLLKGWSRRWPLATARVLHAIGGDLAAALALSPCAAALVGSISPAQPLMGGLESVLIGALPALSGPWLDAALERPEVRRAAAPHQVAGWTPLTAPPLERRWPDGRAFPPIETIAGAQARLTWLGLDPGPVDGVLGERTLRALHRFQLQQCLEPTGRLDRATVDALAFECTESP